VDDHDRDDEKAKDAVDEVTKAGAELTGSDRDVVDGSETDLDAVKCDETYHVVHDRWLAVKRLLRDRIQTCEDGIVSGEKGKTFWLLGSRMVLTSPSSP